MPRRPAPSSLILHKGTLPSRGQPKHTLPSVPRPTLAPPITSSSTSRSVVPEIAVALPSASLYSLPAGNVSVNSVSVYSACSSPCQPVRRRSIERGSLSPFPSPSPLSSPGPSSSPRKTVRGPWDHSRVESLPIDVDAMLALPKPVAISP